MVRRKPTLRFSIISGDHLSGDRGLVEASSTGTIALGIQRRSRRACIKPGWRPLAAGGCLALGGICNPWAAGHWQIAGDTKAVVGSRVYEPRAAFAEASIKIGWSF